MLRDITFGSGDFRASAIIISKYRNISENSVSYWITLPRFKDIIHCWVYVMKDCPLGKRISNMISKSRPEEDILNLVTARMFKKLNFEEIMEIIDHECRKAYRKGYNDKTNEIRNVLKFYNEDSVYFD